MSLKLQYVYWNGLNYKVAVTPREILQQIVTLLFLHALDIAI